MLESTIFLIFYIIKSLAVYLLISISYILVKYLVTLLILSKSFYYNLRNNSASDLL